MRYQYGKGHWDTLWEKLEQEGNVGLDYVINPVLYGKIVGVLANTPKAVVVDFGCGTNLMGIQLLYGYSASVPALQGVSDLDRARFNVMLYIGLEGQTELVKRSRSYLKDLGYPTNLATVEAHIGDSDLSLFDPESVELCVSRNFLMHLSKEAYVQHLEQVYQILKPGGHLIFAVLNPDYEQEKCGGTLKDGERYEFAHGKQGEHGTFYHYYKTIERLESGMALFQMKDKIPCFPMTDAFQKTHERYYNPEVPMAFVYVLRRT